jgi:hypothetical protein
MTVADTALDTYAICPVGTFEAWYANWEADCARELLRWTLLETFNGRIVPLSILRKKFVALWHARWPENATRDGQAYWAGIKTGRGVAAILDAFFDRYLVLQPYQPYELPVARHLVTGEYAIVGRRRPDPRVPEGPAVLVAHPWKPTTSSRPQVSALAQWKHAMMRAEYTGLGLYHLPLLRGRGWRHPVIREALVERWLFAILEAGAQGLRFPAPSSHCDGCVAKPCMKVFDV